MDQLPSAQSQSSNVYRIEDIIDYCKCPLRYRYKTWNATQRVVDAREAVQIASRDAIRAYLQQGIDNRASPRLALDRATAAYKMSLIEFDSKNLFSGDMNWATHFNFGMVLIRKFHEKINHHTDRPIMGPKSCSYPIGEDVVIGDIDGFIAFNVQSRSEIRYGVVDVARRPGIRSTWERMREGFAYGAFRQLTHGLHSVTVSMVNVDPFSRKVMEYELTPEDKSDFETLAAVAINGIKHQVFMPQPIKANCRTCPYDDACKIKYARPGESKWHKKEFLGSVDA